MEENQTRRFDYGQYNRQSAERLEQICCSGLEPGDGRKCTDKCVRDQQQDETAIPSDVGFYHKFDFDPETGRPSGCPGYESDEWKNDIHHKIVYPKCDKEDYAPEGEALYSIVDDYADNQQKWMEDFIDVLVKMMATGYTDSDLTDSPYV